MTRLCEHRSIQTWSITEGDHAGEVALWACQECRMRFYPASERVAIEAAAVRAATTATITEIREWVGKMEPGSFTTWIWDGENEVEEESARVMQSFILAGLDGMIEERT